MGRCFSRCVLLSRLTENLWHWPSQFSEQAILFAGMLALIAWQYKPRGSFLLLLVLILHNRWYKCCSRAEPREYKPCLIHVNRSLWKQSRLMLTRQQGTAILLKSKQLWNQPVEISACPDSRCWGENNTALPLQWTTVDGFARRYSVCQRLPVMCQRQSQCMVQ